ncbi:hypothetical protein HDU98_004928 [Podochytrium sp. JEL0797]|nr:hypothetical protein HDU98_004928 [Podochytrium sp. JEL0797]
MLRGGDPTRSSLTRLPKVAAERNDPEIISNKSDASEGSFEIPAKPPSKQNSLIKQRPHTAAPTTSSASSSKTTLSKSNESLTRRPQSAAAPKTRLSAEDLDRLSKPLVYVEKKLIKSMPNPTTKLPPPAPGNAHKRYSSVYPCANRLLAKRWDDAARKKHQDKLATMKTYIDNTPPQVQGHLKDRAKKISMEDQKLVKIERENHILLARMVRQMSVVQGFSGLDADSRVKVTAAMPTPSARKKKELLEQIEDENQILMQRVEARLPHYRQEVWDEERRTNLSYLQRISRFPEGYQHVFERVGVPPPLKGPLRIRANRSEKLRQQWAVESKTNLDEFGNPRRAASPNKSSSSEDGSSDEDERQAEITEVYLTKAERLRREYIQALQKGGERNWRTKHPASTNDLLDISRMDMSSSEDEARKKQAPKISVKLNRAQLLRLEEQNARKREQEQIKVTTDLSNIEARINYGQDGGKQEKLKLIERDRESQFANSNPDESEYEPMVFQLSEEQEEMKDATWNQVFHGICHRAGFKLPEAYPVSVGVLWSSEESDSSIERWEILNRVLPKVKSRANQLGIEIMIRDLKWGVPKSLKDRHLEYELSSAQLEKYMNSVGIHFICFMSHKLGQIGILPPKISINLFNSIMENISSTDGPKQVDLVQKWYRLNENTVPPSYSLVNISTIIPEFGISVNTRGFRNGKDEWLRAKADLFKCMSCAASELVYAKNWSEEEMDTLALLRKSKLEIESMRAIPGHTEDAILILRDLEWVGERTRENIGTYLDWAGEIPDVEAANHLDELKQKLQEFTKDSNIIKDEVEFVCGAGLRPQDSDMKR